jgi:hypothetical protein
LLDNQERALKPILLGFYQDINTILNKLSDGRSLEKHHSFKKYTEALIACGGLGSTANWDKSKYFQRFNISMIL